jgi:hypothetical protein
MPSEPNEISQYRTIGNSEIVKSRLHNLVLKRCEITVEDNLVLTDLYHNMMKFDTCISENQQIERVKTDECMS